MHEVVEDVLDSEKDTLLRDPQDIRWPLGKLPAVFAGCENARMLLARQKRDPQDGGKRRVQERIVDTDQLPRQTTLAAKEPPMHPRDFLVPDGVLAFRATAVRKAWRRCRLNRDDFRDLPLDEEDTWLLLAKLYLNRAYVVGSRATDRRDNHHQQERELVHLPSPAIIATPHGFLVARGW